MTPSESIAFYAKLVARHAGLARLARAIGQEELAQQHEKLAQAARQFLAVAQDKAKHEGTQNDSTTA